MSAGIADRSGGSLVQRAIDAVSDHIRTSQLRVGDTLPGEAHFAGQLGVSRAVMREAFGALAALRLIDVGNGRKPRVGGIDGSVIATSLGHAVSTAQISVADVWDVRRTLELRTAELAAVNRSDEQAAEIVGLAKRIEAENDDSDAVTRHDVAMHQAIARASGNMLFAQIIRSFEGLMQVAVPTAWETRETPEQRSRIIERHHALANSIARRDPNEARAEMEAHFDASIGDILRNS